MNRHRQEWAFVLYAVTDAVLAAQISLVPLAINLYRPTIRHGEKLLLLYIILKLRASDLSNPSRQGQESSDATPHHTLADEDCMTALLYPAQHAALLENTETFVLKRCQLLFNYTVDSNEATLKGYLETINPLKLAVAFLDLQVAFKFLCDQSFCPSQITILVEDKTRPMVVSSKVVRAEIFQTLLRTVHGWLARPPLDPGRRRESALGLLHKIRSTIQGFGLRYCKYVYTLL